MKTPIASIHRGYGILVAALAVAGFAALAVHAATPSDATPQGGGHHRHHCGPGGHFMHVLKQLDLSPEQQTQIKGVLAAAKPEFQELSERACAAIMRR